MDADSASGGRWLAPADRAVAGWLFLTALFLYVLTSGGHFYASDDVQKFKVLEAFRDSGTVAFREGWAPGRDGLRYSWFPAGGTLLMVPGFLMGQVLGAAFPAVTIEFASRFFITLQNAVFSAALVTLVFLYVRYLGHTRAAAGLSAAALGLGSMVWPYSKTAWSEPGTALFAFGGLFALQIASREEFRRLGPVLLAGLGLGAAYAVRQETALLAVGAGLVIAWTHRAQWRTLLFRLPVFALPIAGAVGLNLAYNWMRYGNATQFANFQAVPGGLDQPGLGIIPWSLTNLYHYTLNPGDGLLWYSPPLILGLLAWGLFWREHPREAKLLTPALGLLAFFLIAIWSLSDWAWGLRYSYVFLPFLAVPLAVLWDRGHRTLLWSFLAIGIAVQAIAVLHNFNHLYEAERRAHPTLGVQQMMREPAHAPVWQALKATPTTLQGAAAILTAPPPTGGTDVGQYRERAQHVPDFWYFLLLTTPMSRAPIALAFLAALAAFAAAAFQLRRHWLKA